MHPLTKYFLKMAALVALVMVSLYVLARLGR
jgi:flagellar biogenesis protein FliO